MQSSLLAHSKPKGAADPFGQLEAAAERKGEVAFCLGLAWPRPRRSKAAGRPCFKDFLHRCPVQGFGRRPVEKVAVTAGMAASSTDQAPEVAVDLVEEEQVVEVEQAEPGPAKNRKKVVVERPAQAWFQSWSAHMKQHHQWSILKCWKQAVKWWPEVFGDVEGQSWQMWFCRS
eukprot:4502400-Amphidinium_carterae.1